MPRFISILAALALFVVPAAAYADSDVPMTYESASAVDIVDLAVADGRFTTLIAALGAAGLVDTLRSDGPFTVFAPTDEAFALLPAGTVEALLGDIPALTDILLYHVVAGAVSAADVVQLSFAETAEGKWVMISAEGNNVMINNSRIVITDLVASNGIVHVIDAVLLPPAD
jgi:transforming growth factor-beta-induced protein